jgi:hypothetical protein
MYQARLPDLAHCLLPATFKATHYEPRTAPAPYEAYPTYIRGPLARHHNNNPLRVALFHHLWEIESESHLPDAPYVYQPLDATTQHIRLMHVPKDEQGIINATSLRSASKSSHLMFHFRMSGDRLRRCTESS